MVPVISQWIQRSELDLCSCRDSLELNRLMPHGVAPLVSEVEKHRRFQEEKITQAHCQTNTPKCRTYLLSTHGEAAVMVLLIDLIELAEPSESL
mmetsp:Transcript_72514/g.130549  ORF Transcript_72514/g.130549 Transcript_72514/m.130549 type:complete len:94 (-) Transcript_72514:97-378(-)